MADIKMGQLLHRPSNAPIDKTNPLEVQLTGNLPAIKGQYGDALIPVQVDAEGRLVIAADVIVDAEGLVIDATQMGQGPAGAEPWLVKLQSNAMEYYGATLGERPAATDVPVGAVYTAVQTQESWQSDGTEWVAIGAVVMIGGQLVARREP